VNYTVYVVEVWWKIILSMQCRGDGKLYSYMYVNRGAVVNYTVCMVEGRWYIILSI
jgi:hypothetical protein